MPSIETFTTLDHIKPAQADGGYLFSKVSSKQIRETMEWRGSTEEILERLEEVSTDGVLGKNFWFPERLVRAALHAQHDMLPGEGQGYVNAMTSYALTAYAHGGDRGALGNVKKLVANKGLLERHIRQPGDFVTSEGLIRSCIRGAANRVVHGDTAKRAGLLLLPVGYGGIAAGLELALLAKVRRRKLPMAIYPFVFSRLKLGHVEPQLSDTAIRTVKRYMGDGWQVRVVDDDASTGKTVGRTISYLHEKTGETGITGVAARDARDEKTRQAQGDYWQHALV